MAQETNGISHQEIGIDIAASFVEQFSDLSRELDKQRQVPESRVAKYTFEDVYGLYAYPSVVNDYIDIFHLSVENIKITVGKNKGRLAALTIQVLLDNKETLEMSTDPEQPIEDDFQLTALGGDFQKFPKGYRIKPQEMSRLLISMALPPSDVSEIDQARADQQQISDLNPRDPQVLQLIENSLENQAESHVATQEFNKKIVNPFDQTETDFKFIVTKNSDGDMMFDASANSHAGEKDELLYYNMSVSCNFISGMSEVMSSGTQTKINIDGIHSVQLDETVITSYMAGIAQTLTNQQS